MKKLSIPKVKSSQPKSSSRKKLSFKQGVSLLLISSVALLGLSGYYGYQYVLTDSDRVLSAAIDKSMQTSSVYRTVNQKSNQSNVDQTFYVSFTPQVATQSITNLKENSSIGDTTVTTETIGTKDADYVRYTAIDIKNSTVKRDFSKVLDVWSKRTSNPQTGESVSFLNDSLFVVVPFGNLNSDHRAQIKDKIDSIDLYKASETKKEFKDGRPVMQYTIDIEPQKLVQVLAKYAELSGVGASSQLDPAQYEKAPKIQIKMEIDILSRHINTIDFVGSGRQETYHGYNVDRTIELPTQTIGTDELQIRLQELEKQQ